MGEPDDFDALLDQSMTPNQRRIISSSSGEYERFRQFVAARRDHLTRWVDTASLDDLDHDEHRVDDLMGSLDDWTVEDWVVLTNALEEAEREILRERELPYE